MAETPLENILGETLVYTKYSSWGDEEQDVVRNYSVIIGDKEDRVIVRSASGKDISKEWCEFTKG